MGESPIPDCPDPRNGDYCIRKDKYGILPGQFTTGGKPAHPTSPPLFPPYKVKTDS